MKWFAPGMDVADMADMTAQEIADAEAMQRPKSMVDGVKCYLSDAEQARRAAQEAAQAALELDDKVQEAIEGTVGKALFKIVNEIRVLQSNPELTPAQFRTWFKNQQT